jgi:predicted phage terminase large subunit-like protein
MKYCWPKADPLLVGFHTEKVCEALDQAFHDFRNGKSSYLEIGIPFRHGKSDSANRFGVPHFVGEFPECEVISTAFAQSLTDKMSRDARGVVNSDKFKELYPKVNISRSISSVREWSLDNGVGKTLWSGIGSGITGSGAHFALIDDPYSGREEAESELKRNKKWDAFVDDLMSRLAPTHIVILIATRWHVDDFAGRIREKMKKDKSFPNFKSLTFPAKASLYKGEGKYPNEYLFEERYPKSWYEMQYATRSLYSCSALLDCDPATLSGSVLKCVQGVNWHYVDGKPQGFGSLARGWDLASTEVQLQKDDPDWTIGVRGAVGVKTSHIHDELGESTELRVVSIYIDDIIRIQAEAKKRNMKMVQAAISDGPGCIQYVEAFAAYKDAFTTLKEILKGVAIVEPSRMQGDKMAKITTHLEVPFEFGNVYVNKNIPEQIVNDFFSVCNSFPSGKHDDDPDALAVLVSELTNGGGNIYEGVL